MYIQARFFGFIAQCRGQFQHAVAGDAGQNGAIEAGSDNFVSIREHHVHGADFLDVLLFNTVQPEYL